MVEIEKLKLPESKRERKTKKQKILLIRGFECLIDESIASYIQWLNENGFHTSGCCSGDPIDHHIKKLDPPCLLFPTKLLTKDKRELIINTISEINNWDPELKMKYDISDTNFGFRENNVEYKNFLSLSCKYPAGLHLFFHVLEQKIKIKSDKNENF